MHPDPVQEALAGQRRCAEAIAAWQLRVGMSVGFTIVFALLTALLQSFLAMGMGLFFLVLAWLSLSREHEWINMHDSWQQLADKSGTDLG